MVTSKWTVLTLADGTSLEFPYNNGSNLPLMLPNHQVHIGATRIDKNFLQSAECLSTFLSVAHETNQNINASQKELLLWHWKLGHASFGWIQKLVARWCHPKEGQEERILSTKQPTVSSCQAPLCAALFYIRDGKAKNRKLKFWVQRIKDPPTVSHRSSQFFYFRMIFTMTMIISLLYCYNPHQQHISSITTWG
jgi:hypothetical protein